MEYYLILIIIIGSILSLIGCYTIGSMIWNRCVVYYRSDEESLLTHNNV